MSASDCPNVRIIYTILYVISLGRPEEGACMVDMVVGAMEAAAVVVVVVAAVTDTGDRCQDQDHAPGRRHVSYINL